MKQEAGFKRPSGRWVVVGDRDLLMSRQQGVLDTERRRTVGSRDELFANATSDDWGRRRGTTRDDKRGPEGTGMLEAGNSQRSTAGCSAAASRSSGEQGLSLLLSSAIIDDRVHDPALTGRPPWGTVCGAAFQRRPGVGRVVFCSLWCCRFCCRCR